MWTTQTVERGADHTASRVRNRVKIRFRVRVGITVRVGIRVKG